MRNAFTTTSTTPFSEEEEIMMDQEDIFVPNLENHRDGDDDCGCHSCTGIGFDPRTPEQRARDLRIERAREEAAEAAAVDRIAEESRNSFEEWGDSEFAHED